MELKVGMYVRGSYYQFRGRIGKIIKNYKNDLEIAYKDGILKTTVGAFISDNTDINGRQYITSFDVVDLLKVKDIIEMDVVDEDNYCTILGIQLVRIENELALENIKDMIKNESAKLLSILTEEQFKKTKYNDWEEN